MLKLRKPRSSSHLVWYAVYGSNLLQARFMCYVAGGTPPGSRRANEGCRDKTRPSKVESVVLAGELYFAHRSSRWGGGGIAFMRRSKNSKTRGRMYLITYEQFNDVVLQENGKSVNGTTILPPFGSVPDGKDIVLEHLLYGRLILIGEKDESPILTLTATDTDLKVAAPSEDYLKTIILGLKEAYPKMGIPDILGYLLRADGVCGLVTPTQLDRWISEVNELC